VTSLSGGSNLAITDNGNGTWTVVSSEEGLEELSFTVSDGTTEVTNTATIDFADVDNTAGDDAESVDEDQSVTFNVMDNDNIVDGGTLTAVTQPENGNVSFNDDGTVTYEPDENFNGSDTFTYTVTDEDGETVTATVTMTVDPVNDKPVVGTIDLDDGTEYEPYVLSESDLLANATDVDGDSLSVTGISGDDTLSIVENAPDPETGERSWTITPDEEGAEAITFTVSDGETEVTQSTVIEFADVDNTARDDARNVGEDKSTMFNVLDNDTIIDGGELSSVVQPANGVVAFWSDGTVIYQPNDDFSGTDTFTYNITDEDGEIVTATVTMTVDPENDQPIAVTDITTTDEDQAVTMDLLANDSDVDGDALSITQIDGQDISAGQTIALSDGSGDVTLNADGTVTYDPAENLNGEVNFEYTISDGQGGSDTATATVNIDEVNDGPVAVDDAFGASEDNAVTFSISDLLGNDSDVDSAGLSIAQINGVSLENFPSDGVELNNGTLSYDAESGEFSFEPTADWSGSESLSYTVTDGEGGSAQANIALNVEGVADTPDLAVSLVESGHSGDSVTITYQDTNAGYHNTYGYYILDENGEPSTGQIVFADLHDQNTGDSFVLDGVDQDQVGFFLLSDGDRENSGLFNGMDVTFEQDAAGEWQVLDSNGAPLAHDNNGGLYFSHEEFNGDDLDHAYDDGDVVGSQNWEDQESQYGGNDFDYNDASFNVEWDTSNSETTYDVNISAAITDDDLSESLSVTIEDFPEGATFNMGEIVDGKLVISGDDIDNLENLSMTVPGDSADFSLNVTATATEPNGSTASTSLTVSPNFDPEAVDDLASVTEGQSITMDVVANDSDADGDTLSITQIDGQDIEAGGTVNVDNGTVTLNEDGSVTFTANNGYEGPTDFNYTVSDGQGGSDSATVNLSIEDGNIAPVAQDDSATTQEDTAVTIDLLDNDSDANNDALSISQIDGQNVSVGDTIVLSDGSGQVTLLANGEVSFEPSENANGEISFDYTIVDPEGMSDTASVSVDVDAVNDGPVAQADNADTLEDNAVTFNPLGNDSDVDGDSLSIIQINGEDIAVGGSVDVDHGAVSLNTDGTVTFTPDSDYAGTQNFEYTVSDGQGGTSTATASVDDVEADADMPDLTLNIGEGQVVSGDVEVTEIPHGISHVIYQLSDGSTVKIDEYPGDNKDPSDPAQWIDEIEAEYGEVEGYTIKAGQNHYDEQGNQVADIPNQADEETTVNELANVETDGNVSISGDSYVEFPIEVTAGATDADGSESLSGVTLSNIPQEATLLVDGVEVSVSDGSAMISADNLDNIVLRVPAGQENFDLSASVTSTESSNEDSETATVSAEVSIPDVNTGPEAYSDTLSGDEDQVISFSANDLLGNDTDVDGDSLSIVGFEQPDYGTIADLGDGNYTFTPNADWNGQTDFSYTISDGQGGTDTATVTIDVNGVNDAPETGDDSADTLEDNSVTFNPLGNDSDVEGDNLSITQIDGVDIEVGGSVDVGNGSVSLNADGTVTFEPDGNYAGTQEFEYTVSDGQGGTSTATASVDVEADADVPELSVSVGDGVTETTGGDPVEVTINSDNATSSGNGFTVTAKTVDENGDLEDSSIAYNNNPVGFGVAGQSSGASSEIGYDNAHDASEQLIFEFDNDVSSVDVSVAWLHGGEDAVYTMYQDGVEVGSGLIDGGSDRVDPAITLSADGGVDFDQIVFSAPGGGDDYLIHSLEFETAEGGETTTTYPLDITSNLMDTDGSESLSLTVDGLPEGAVLSAGTQNEDGSWTLEPGDLEGLSVTVPGEGSDFTVEVSATATESSNGDSETVTASATVIANSDPEAVDDSVTTTEDNGVVLDLVANDSDNDNDSLTITHIDGQEIEVGGSVDVAHGTVSLNEDGSVTFEPTGDYAGDQSFDYTVSDGQGGTATATASVDVEAVADAPDLSLSLGEPTPYTVDGAAGETSTLFTTTFDDAEAGFQNQPVDGWSTSSDAIEVWNDESDEYSGDGSYIELNDDNRDHYEDATSIHRSIDTQEDATYTFNFDYSGRPGYDEDVTAIEVRVDGVKVAEFSHDNSDGNDNDWQDGSFSFTGTGEPMVVEFVSVGDAQNYGRGMYLDNIEAVQTLPDAADETYYDYPLNIAAAETDVDGSETLSGVTLSGLPEGAVVLVDGQEVAVSDGSVTLSGDNLDNVSLRVPQGAADFDLTASVTSTDGTDTATTTTTASVDLPVENEGPVAADDSASTDEDSAIILDLVDNDTDANDDSLSITQIDGVNIDVGDTVDVGNGMVTLNEDGSINFMPSENFSGEVSFDYTVSDGQGASDTATASIDVAGVADGAEVSVNIGDGELIGDLGSGGDSSGGRGDSSAGRGDSSAGRGDSSAGRGDSSAGRGDSSGGSSYDHDIDGTSNSEYLYGTDDDDNIDASHGNDWVYARDGDDYVDGGNGDDTLYGGDGDDTLVGGHGFNKLYGGDGDDVINGGTSADFVSGGDGDDVIETGHGADTVYMGDGDDTVTAGTGNDIIYGGDGNDTLVLSGDSEDYAISSYGSGYMLTHYGSDGTDYIQDVENLRFNDGEISVTDFIAGGSVSDGSGSGAAMAYPVTFAVSMLDSSESLADDGLMVDLSTVPVGSELVIANTTVSVDENGSISVDGDDVSVDGTTMSIPSDTLGEDMSVSATVTVPVDENGDHDSFDLTASVQTVDGDDVSIENIDADVAGTQSSEIGTDGDDVLYAGYGEEDVQLSGGEGDDTLYDSDGDDVLIGGDGDDTLVIGDGEDVMNGGAGEDLFIFNATADSGTSGQDWVDGGEDFDTIHLNGSESWTLTITGGDGSQEVITSDSASAEQMSDYQDVSGMTGQIEFDDGSTVIFEGVEKVEW